MDVNLDEFREMVRDREAWRAATNTQRRMWVKTVRSE